MFFVQCKGGFGLHILRSFNTYSIKAHLWLFHAAKSELEKSQGAFITTASLAGVRTSGSSLPYMVTKAAAIHLSRALAVIAGPNIRVNSISPGLLLTEWGMKFPEERREAARNATKLKRLATVEVCITNVHKYKQANVKIGLCGRGADAGAQQVHNRPEHRPRWRCILVIARHTS